jgi:hypothetical protein
MLKQSGLQSDSVPKPALTFLHVRLKDWGIDADPARVASVILDVFRDKMPDRDPELLVEWMQQLALEVLRGRILSDSIENAPRTPKGSSPTQPPPAKKAVFSSVPSR